MKKLFFAIGVLAVLGITSCQQNGGGGAKYAAINRQRAIMLIDQETGEVFMMELQMEKGKGVTGANWKSLGSVADAK